MLLVVTQISREEFHGSFLKIASVTSRGAEMVVLSMMHDPVLLVVQGGCGGLAQWFQTFFLGGFSWLDLATLPIFTS